MFSLMTLASVLDPEALIRLDGWGLAKEDKFTYSFGEIINYSRKNINKTLIFKRIEKIERWKSGEKAGLGMDLGSQDVNLKNSHECLESLLLISDVDFNVEIRIEEMKIPIFTGKLIYKNKIPKEALKGIVKKIKMNRRGYDLIIKLVDYKYLRCGH